MVFWIKIVLFLIPDDPSSQLLRFIRFWAPFFQKIVDDQLKYHSKTIYLTSHEEKTSYTTLAKHAGMDFYLHGKSCFARLARDHLVGTTRAPDDS